MKNQAGRKRSAFFMMKNFILLLLFQVSTQIYGQWTSVAIPSTASFRALKTFKKHIWVGGTKGTIGHSKDRGKRWEFMQVPDADKLDFRDLVILNENELILMSAGPSEESKAVLYHTKDQGKNWTRLWQKDEPGYFFDCILWDPKIQQGWLLADPIQDKLRLFSFTRNSFSSIDSMHSPALQKKEAFFAASGSSMIQTGNHILLVGGGADSTRVYRFDLQNKNWQTVPLHVRSGEAKGYFSIGAKNANELWAVGGDYRKLNESTIPIITSEDGGQNWTVLQNSPTFYMEKVIWAKPYWIVNGPSQSAAYHKETNRWKSLGNTTYHNIIQVGNVIWGIGAKGQLGYISLSSIDQLFLSEK